MREKMFGHITPAHAKAADAPVFDLKHSRGGIVDLEFMVQYLVLARSFQHPGLTRYTDNIRILESAAEAGLLERGESEALIGIYRAYRAEGHKRALQQAKNEVPATLFANERSLVLAAWEKVFAQE